MIFYKQFAPNRSKITRTNYVPFSKLGGVHHLKTLQAAPFFLISECFDVFAISAMRSVTPSTSTTTTSTSTTATTTASTKTTSWLLRTTTPSSLSDVSPD